MTTQPLRVLFPALIAVMVLMWSGPGAAQVTARMPSLTFPLEVRLVDGRVDARRGADPVWHLPGWPDTQLLNTDEACLIVWHGAFVDVVERETGRVVDRLRRGSTGDGEVLLRDPRDDGGEVVLVSLDGEDASYPYTCERGFSVYPPFEAAYGLEDLQARDEARSVLVDAGLEMNTLSAQGSSWGGTTTVGPEPTMEERLRSAPDVEMVPLIATYEALAAQIPVNPWYQVYAAQLLWRSGDVYHAGLILDALINHTPDPEWVRLAGTVATFDPPTAEVLFERGLLALRGRGYVPELNVSPVAVALLLGGSISTASPEQRLSLAERLWLLAPNVEGSAAFFDKVALEQEDAVMWQRRADEVREESEPLAWSQYGSSLGTLLHLLLASLLAFVSLFAVEASRRGLWRGQKRRGLGLVGAARLCVVGLIGSACVTPMVQGIGELTALSTMPMAVQSGSLASPTFLDYWAEAEPNDGTTLLAGMAAQAAGQLDEALAFYERSSRPAARANSGRIYQLQGRREEALSAWSEVPPDVPAYGVVVYFRDGVVSGAEVERAVAVDAGETLLAIPTVFEGRRALHGRVSSAQPLSGLAGSLQAVDHIVLFDAIVFAVGSIVLIALLIMRPPPEQRGYHPSKRAWWFGMIVPGGAWHWHVVGALVAVFVYFSAISWWMTLSTHGVAADLVGLLVEPPARGLFGEQVSAVTGLARWTTLGARLGPWVILASVGIPLVLERVFPDPEGPHADGR